MIVFSRENLSSILDLASDSALLKVARGMDMWQSELLWLEETASIEFEAN